ECIHTYSLVHDDLPCMDDDDLRRGRATTHKAFDEATALLAGDALLTHAFVILTVNYASQPAMAHALCRELAAAAGSRRLIGGQMEDLLAEKRTDVTAGDLDLIHLNKTAAMIEASLVMGGIVGGADSSTLDTLRRIGRHLGLTFQIVDDILDATADTATLGKTAGKDAQADKTTYVKLHGIEKARKTAAQQTEKAIASIASLPRNTEFLVELTKQLTNREK
ncbi:MAG: polyprenyl synthetase family protein, partial [Cephaloticoccus sp.]|nr:polyprenyl synthetase family protein [Cephaloticoccus sp.]